MKTAGIITLYGLINYGNRLQNYAVHKILKDIGIKSKTYIDRPSKYMSKMDIITGKINLITNYRFSSNPNAAKKRNREIAFYSFTRRYIPTDRFVSLQDLSKKADYFVVGSDQVWNPIWYTNTDKQLFLLTFAKKEQKVCLSPSFGLCDLPDEWKNYFREKLKDFTTLSVREKSGADIIKELTGRTAEVLIDPTLMFDDREWIKIAKKPRNINIKKPYVLTYFIGNIPDSAKQKLNEVLGIKSLTVYNLMDDFPEFYACGPREFIYMISKASLILTDSFHACAFAFLFSKPFLVFEREDGNADMFSRIKSFLMEFYLERKMANSNLENSIFECDYAEGKKKLELLREKEIEFLKNTGLGDI